MMGRILIILYLLCGTNMCRIKAQYSLPDSLFKQMFEARIKQVDEFFSVFNSNKAVKGFTTTDPLKRQRQIFRLTNHEMGAQNKKEMFEKIMRFADTIYKDSVYLHFSDSTWFAEVDCNILFKGKEQKITLFLQTEKVKEYIYKWVVCGAKGKLLELPTDTTKQYMIPPIANELNFMYLSTITDQNHAPYITSYKAQNIPIHTFSVFLAMIWSGNLKIVNAEKVKFHFLQVPNYVFTISYFDRESMNAGWLIDSVFAIKEEDKPLYTNLLFSM